MQSPTTYTDQIKGKYFGWSKNECEKIPQILFRWKKTVLGHHKDNKILLKW
jgi:hypothetical protein